MAVRKNQASLSDAEKTAFVKAVRDLKQQPSQLHSGSPVLSRYDDYVELHVKAMMAMPSGWAHGGPAFFPWHRVLLLQIERDLQQMANDPTLGIPYWDWTKSGAPTDTPLRPDFLGGNGTGTDRQVQDGPFASAIGAWPLNVVDSPGAPNFLQRNFGKDLDRQNKPIDINLPDAKAQDDALNIRWYDSSPWDVTSSRPDSFRNRAESALHNRVHRWVGGSWLSNGQPIGGTMMQMSSPNDPVFWLHHCNLDRLWATWQQRHLASAPYLPYAGAAPGHNLHDPLIFGDPMPWLGTYTPVMVIDNYALGYSYDTLVAPITVPAAPVLAMRAMAQTPMQERNRLLFPLPSELKSQAD